MSPNVGKTFGYLAFIAAAALLSTCAAKKKNEKEKDSQKWAGVACRSQNSVLYARFGVWQQQYKCMHIDKSSKMEVLADTTFAGCHVAIDGADGASAEVMYQDAAEADGTCLVEGDDADTYLFSPITESAATLTHTRADGKETTTQLTCEPFARDYSSYDEDLCDLPAAPIYSFPALSIRSTATCDTSTYCAEYQGYVADALAELKTDCEGESGTWSDDARCPDSDKRRIGACIERESSASAAVGVKWFYGGEVECGD